MSNLTAPKQNTRPSRSAAPGRRRWPSDRARVVILPVVTLIAVILLWAGATALSTSRPIWSQVLKAWWQNSSTIGCS